MDEEMITYPYLQKYGTGVNTITIKLVDNKNQVTIKKFDGSTELIAKDFMHHISLLLLQKEFYIYRIIYFIR